MQHVRQSGPESGLDFQGNILHTVRGVPSSLGSAGETPRKALQTSIKSHYQKILSTFGDKITKWLQERTDGSKNGLGIAFEGPGVDKLTDLYGS